MPTKRIRPTLGFVVLFAGRTMINLILTLLFMPTFLVTVLVRSDAGPRLLRWYLEACGAAFVKMGQILAMRYDLLPAEYCHELSKLLDRMPPVSISRILSIVERDLGRPVTDCYSEFEATPLASASIAQVHGATLLDGTPVVVKVMRPGIQQRFRIDLVYIRLLGVLLEIMEPLVIVGSRRIIGELIHLTREELDFRREARNIEVMHQRMQDDEIDHYAPMLYPSLCGRHVITMERIEGVSVKDMILALESGDQHLLQTWAAAGIRSRRTARLLMRSVLEQCMRHRLFHADPHAANLIVMKGGTLAWVDFGMLGSLDEKVWIHQFKLREAVTANQLDAAYKHFLAGLEPIPLVDLSGFEVEAKEYLRDWIASSESTMSTISEKSSAFFFIRIFDAIRRAKLNLPLGLMRLYRTIIVADIVMLRLDPQIDWMPVLKEFIADEQRRRILSIVQQGFSASAVSSALVGVLNLPNSVLSVTGWVHDHLPEMGRVYRLQMTRFERMVALTLRYSQVALLFAMFAVIGSKFLVPGFFPMRGWLRVAETMQSYWFFLLMAGVVLMLLLQKLTHEFHRPTPR